MNRRVHSLLAVPALTTAAALLFAGCSGSSDKESAGSTPAAVSSTKAAGPVAGSAASAKPATLEELADTVGCAKAEEGGKTLDYRQGVCKTADAEYVLLTFDTAKGQRDWLDISQMYGGVYLVGNRWALSASPRSAMEAARDKLGGTIEESAGYGASPSGA